MSRIKTGGRKAGTPNKLTQTAKQAFEYAFDRIGGAEHLTEWASQNETEFYRIFARLLPRDLAVSGPDGEAIGVQFIIRG